ncbi:hypothetical protein AcV5_008209 [Taiwanofungus camphoratus]|nr:hypothetical protein AcV5_008209 [Antrodia cinnamomea]
MAVYQGFSGLQGDEREGKLQDYSLAHHLTTIVEARSAVCSSDKSIFDPLLPAILRLSFCGHFSRSVAPFPSSPHLQSAGTVIMMRLCLARYYMVLPLRSRTVSRIVSRCSSRGTSRRSGPQCMPTPQSVRLEHDCILNIRRRLLDCLDIRGLRTARHPAALYRRFARSYSLALNSYIRVYL